MMDMGRLLVLLLMSMTVGASELFTGVVVDVMDGAFIGVRDQSSGRRVLVHLDKIASHPVRTVFGDGARNVAVRWCARNTIVRVEISEQNFRSVDGEIRLSGGTESLSAVLVREGLAWLRWDVHDADLEREQGRAIIMHRGIWSVQTAIHPQYWLRSAYCPDQRIIELVGTPAQIAYCADFLDSALWLYGVSTATHTNVTTTARR